MKKLIVITLFFVTYFCFSQQQEFPFLDNKAMGSYDFIKQNPECDGSGILIFILDNGVDPSIPGLKLLPNGKTKVIEMRDFSNQVALELKEAKIENIGGKDYLVSGDTKLQGFENLKYKPSDGKYFIAVLNEEEYFNNSSVKDLNNNGKTNDSFAFLVFKIDEPDKILKDAPGLVKAKANDEVWVYYVDENANGVISDDLPRFEYKYTFDTFSFFDGSKTRRTEFVSSACIDSRTMKIKLHTNDGSHGSHCAGIAAGYGIYGVGGNDGIATGAYVASLKIGSNVLSGGATTLESKKKAYEYGIEFMKEAGFKYAVFSMSYGIGSESPGQSELEKFLNDFAVKHPNIVIVTSNGNDGPGINSTGNPAGSSRIISAGAMLPPQILENLYGSARKTNWVTHFSSRGGETAKPDVVAPGGASSTVPNFERGDAFWGTSMACPQVAGAAAILFSAAIKNNMDVDGFMLKKALKATARPIPGYTHIDYGSGLVNIQDAFNALKIFAAREESTKILDYKISTTNTYYDGLKGEAAFWKAGGYVPSDKQTVTVSAIFPLEMSESAKQDFYRAFNLKSNVDWLKPDKAQFYIRGNLPGRFSMFIDKSKINSPGIYVGRISAVPTNEKGNYTDFDVQATIIIPYKFDNSNNYSLTLKDRTLGIGDMARIFVEVPPGATTMNIKLSPSGNKPYGMAMYVFSPDGKRYTFRSVAGAENNKDIIINIEKKDLKTGIWEILPYCNYQSMSASSYDLNVEFYGFAAEPEFISEYSQKIGELPEFKFKISNLYGNFVSANFKGSINGYGTKQEHSIKNKETFSTPITVGSDISKIDFYFETNLENFNKVTDMAINIYDASGNAVYSDGASRKTIDFSFTPKHAGNYKLEIVPAFVSKEIMQQSWEFSLESNYHYIEKIDLTAKSPTVLLYPGVWQTLILNADKVLSASPDGTYTIGEIDFLNTNNNTLIYKQKIRL